MERHKGDRFLRRESISIKVNNKQNSVERRETRIARTHAHTRTFLVIFRHIVYVWGEAKYYIQLTHTLTHSVHNERSKKTSDQNSQQITEVRAKISSLYRSRSKSGCFTNLCTRPNENLRDKKQPEVLRGRPSLLKFFSPLFLVDLAIIAHTRNTCFRHIQTYRKHIIPVIV